MAFVRNMLGRGTCEVRFGSIADVHSHNTGIKMAALFAAGLMPWPKHFSLKTSGRLQQLIFPITVDPPKAGGRASMTGQP